LSAKQGLIFVDSEELLSASVAGSCYSSMLLLSFATRGERETTMICQNNVAACSITTQRLAIQEDANH
jgi:hypothetical protein